jgi:hypothetical protein
MWISPTFGQILMLQGDDEEYRSRNESFSLAVGR